LHGGCQVIDEEGRTIGEALDDLVYMLSEVNRHAHFLKSRGLSAQFSVNGYDYGDNGYDYGDTVYLRIEGAPTNVEQSI
jgi:hypothetical protein